MKGRTWWFVVGAATQGLFLATVVELFLFFRIATLPTTDGSLAVDLLLALQFAVVHSFLLHPWTRARLQHIVPGPVYGCVFALTTCLGVLLTCLAWQPCRPIVWNLKGPAGWTIEAAYIGAWISLIYSISLTGLGYQTGFSTWWPWIRGKPVPRRSFEPRGAYRWMRHPVYLSFMGLIWLTPLMTTDRLLLACVWSVYILIGSSLKDQRLVHFMGDRYRRYQAEVPGYPGIFIGPLARVPFTNHLDNAES